MYKEAIQHSKQVLLDDSDRLERQIAALQQQLTLKRELLRKKQNAIEDLDKTLIAMKKP